MNKNIIIYTSLFLSINFAQAYSHKKCVNTLAENFPSLKYNGSAPAGLLTATTTGPTSTSQFSTSTGSCKAFGYSEMKKKNLSHII